MKYRWTIQSGFGEKTGFGNFSSKKLDDLRFSNRNKIGFHAELFPKTSAI